MLAVTTHVALGGKPVSVTAPIEVDLQHELLLAADDLVIVEQPVTVVATKPVAQRDPVMLFVYLGILSLIAIVATAAYLAF